MKQLLLLYAALMMTICSRAQKSFEGLVQAERSFAAFAVAHSTKEAFLAFIDSNGVVFDQGKPVNGIAFWLAREKRPGVLNWYPQYADIAVSKDFGFTSGPWTFRNTVNDSITARGRYTTVWHITRQGEWKFLVDLGVNNVPPPYHNEPGFCFNLASTTNTHFRGSLRELRKVEKRFIRRVSKVKDKDALKYVYDQFLTPFYVLNRNDREPATGQDLLFAVMNETPKNFQYSVAGYNIAASGDIGCAYGTTFINGKTENYLRIWRKETEGWKIVVEVIRY